MVEEQSLSLNLSSTTTCAIEHIVDRHDLSSWLDTDPLGWELADWLIDNDLSIDDNGQFRPNNIEAIYLPPNIESSSNDDTQPASYKNATHPFTHDETTDKMNNGLNNTNAPNISNTSNNSTVTNSISNKEVITFDGDTSRANPHFIPLLPAPIHRGETGRQLIMDTETTGLDALKGDRIVEVGIVEMVNRKFTGEKLHVYINPERSMDEEVIRIHGISEAFLADKPTFEQVAKPLYDFMIGAEVIAHNASFDISFLSMEFDKVGLSDFADKITVTDSLAMAKRQYPGQKNTLDALVRRLNVGKMDRTFHGALLDSEILAEVYLAMTGGQVSLAIDEDIQTDGNQSHADLSHLANKISNAGNYTVDHINWIAKQIAKYPDLAQTQGVSCFYKTQDSVALRDLILHQPANIDTRTINLTSNLFLANA